jgi:hypothetical protein
MIKNFKDKLIGRVVNLPVYAASTQKYTVTEVTEKCENPSLWKGSMVLDRIETHYTVPDKIVVDIEKPIGVMEYTIYVEVHNTDSLNSSFLKFNVMAVPANLRTLESTMELIKSIIDNPKIDYFN